MLIAMEPLAVRSGITVERFWDMNLREIIIQSKANQAHRIDVLKERAIMDHKLSELMAYAVNEPNKMPDVHKMYGFLDKSEREKAQQETEMPEWKRDQIEFMKQAEKIKNYQHAKTGGE
ncbi:hypothetical protein FAM23282_01441 [Lentilactobacillus parabuchneri]|nr:hypothetical protein FAM23282_01441 [Lentilactobacillus parabuchneri]